MTAGRLLRFWTTFEEPVHRGAYRRHGLALMTLKYGVDALLVGLAAGVFWTPLDYLQSVPFLLSARFSGASSFLAPALALWTLPFLWIGICMTIRRLLDVGWSAWWSLLFFVPVASYLLLALLAFVDGRAEGVDRERPPGDSSSGPPQGSTASARLPSALLSIAAGGALGLAMTWWSVHWLESYGLALFMGTPFVIGLATGFLFCRRFPGTLRETMEVVLMTVLIVGGAAFVLGVEGAVCLLMLMPLGLVLAMMGGVVGRFIVRQGEGLVRGGVMVAVLLPGGAWLERGTVRGGDSSGRLLHEVRSEVLIAASPETVWDQVIAFSPLPEPTEAIFRLGVAYPVRAEIEGSGVGALRLCVFSTGAFVEPITAWEPGRRLSFDVVRSPPPLKELSFREVAPPHLEGYLIPRRGEFRLVALSDGRTRLEGSTWYEQRLRPEAYWALFSDHLIATIHRRVLDHIRDLAEAQRAGADRPVSPATDR